MKTIKITSTTNEVRERIKRYGLDPYLFNIPKKGSVLKLENAQKFICRTNKIVDWRKGQSHRHYEPLYACLEVT